MSSAALYVVATPIGNLDDITLRALQVLSEVELIAAEDTRRTRILLARHGLTTELVPLHEHNEKRQAPLLLNRIEAGENVALVCDAGTPLLSDPGFHLVRQALEAGVRVMTVPGPSAVTAALSVSGLATDRFCFEGFLPQRAAARRARLSELQSESRTLVLFESSHRIVMSLSDISAEFGPDRPMALCRELTKRFETVLRGTVGEIRRRVEEDPEQRKGEFVLVLSGRRREAEESREQALELAQALREYLSSSQAARVAANIHGVSRRDLYRALENNRS